MSRTSLNGGTIAMTFNTIFSTVAVSWCSRHRLMQEICWAELEPAGTALLCCPAVQKL
jgi:hypothetical protein